MCIFAPWMQEGVLGCSARLPLFLALAVAFGKGGLSGYDFGAGGSSQAQAAPAAITASDLSTALTASDPQRGAQVAAAEAPNGMAPAAAATVMHHAELNAHFSHPLPKNAPVTCEVCKMQLTSVNDIGNHETGKKHKKNLEKLQDSKVVLPVTCEVCKTYHTSLHSLREHKRSMKHKKNLEKLQDSITPKLLELPNGAAGSNTALAAAVTDGMMTAVQPMENKSSAATTEDPDAGVAEGELKICTMSNVVKKITCEVCKTYYTSIHGLRDHERSRKHEKNLENLQDSITPEPAKPPNDAVGASTEPAAAVTDGVMPAVQPMENKSSTATPEDLETGAAEGEQKICTMASAFERIWKVAQPVTCEVCKTCHKSPLGLWDHENSMKHKKNLEKLQDSITPEPAKPPNDVVGASTEPAAAVTDGVMPAVHPMKRKRSATTSEDLEAKKRRAIEWGAHEGELKICTMCNVLTGTQKAYEEHVSGKKHKAKLQKQQQAQLPDVA